MVFVLLIKYVAHMVKKFLTKIKKYYIRWFFRPGATNYRPKINIYDLYLHFDCSTTWAPDGFEGSYKEKFSDADAKRMS